jgi:two-component system nitrate/nitrite sensor histidine kinase NarX
MLNFFKSWFVKLDKRNRRFLRSGRFIIAFQLVALLSLLLLIALVFFSALPAHILEYLAPVIPWLSLTAIGVVLTLAYSIWNSLLDPLLRLCRWADLMRGVNLDATVVFGKNSDFTELSSDINMLSRMINQLSRETEVQLEKHTDYISMESRSLAILYEVASSINMARDLNELFNKSLHSLCKNLHASAGIIRQVMDSNELEVVATCGEINQGFLADVNQLLPMHTPSKHNSSRQNFYAPGSFPCASVMGSRQENSADIFLVVSVPVQYRDISSGTINLFFPQEMRADIDNYGELFVSIGQHLGTAVEKHRLDEDESQLLVMQERTRFSHELHDSLAQTMASLRIQVRILDELFQSNDEPAIWDQLEQVENAIEQANDQLRELIAHTRIPMNKRGLITSIKEAIQRAREETGIYFYLQDEWSTQELPASIELQVLRIVQECIANIRKHSQAHSVRVLLRSDRVGGGHYVLVEDDGAGFDESEIESVGGEHLGLGILRHRARQIKGDITIDSDPGEGTRITLEFVYPDPGDSLSVSAS